MGRFGSASVVLSAVTISLVGAIITPHPAAAADAGRAASAGAMFFAKLYGVGASSSTDAWAVGFGQAEQGAPTLAITRHWDGRSWTTVPSAHPGDDSLLWGVTDLSPTDAWAVGEWLGGASIQPFAEHWDGSSWQLVALHDPVGLGKLNAVSAMGPDDVWMVGTAYPAPAQTPRTFIEHWDGHAIRHVKAARLPRAKTTELTGVKAVAPDDVWAVGAHGRHGQTYLPLVEHYDGTSWSVVTTDLEAGMSADVTDVDALSSSDAWSVGWEARAGQPTISALVERWDGTSWTHSPALTPGYSSNLTGVSEVAPDDVWVVGTWVRSEQHRASLPLIEHWDGQAWSVVDAPGGRQSSSSIEAVSMADATAGFAVGETSFATHTRGYSVRWDGAAWTR